MVTTKLIENNLNFEARSRVENWILTFFLHFHFVTFFLSPSVFAFHHFQKFMFFRSLKGSERMAGKKCESFQKNFKHENCIAKLIKKRLYFEFSFWSSHLSFFFFQRMVLLTVGPEIISMSSRLSSHVPPAGCSI